jgi:hypothetical protein
MAFHLHLMNALWDYLPAAPRSGGLAAPARGLSLLWKLGSDGRPNAHWIQD